MGRWVALGLATVIVASPGYAIGAQPDAPSAPPADATAPAPQAPAEPPAVTSDQCLEAFGDAQQYRKEGKLLAAHSRLELCAQPACPEIVATKCTEWRVEVTRTLPSIVVSVKGPDGGDLLDAKIEIDGALVTSELTGRPIDLDPGAHELLVTSPSLNQTRKARIVVSESEKNRRVELDFTPPRLIAPPRPPPAPEPPSILVGVHPLTWTLFGVGVASAIVGTATGVVALQKAAELEDACGGTDCAEVNRSLYEEGTAFAHASTATLAIAGAALAGGFITAPLLYEKPRADKPTIVPALGLLFIGVRGTF